MNDIQDIISLIKQSNLKNKFKVWIPSKKDYATLLPLTTNHQKTFVQNLLDSPFVNSPFTISSSKVIAECWLVEENGAFDPSSLNIVDKNQILKGLWIHSNNNHENYKKLLEEYTLELPESNDIIKDNDIEVELFFPSILKEAQYANYILNWTTENLNIEDDKTVHKLNSILYVINSLQYIIKLTIGENEIDFSTLDTQTQIDIGLSLPVTLTEKINSLIIEKYNPIVEKSKQLKNGEEIINVSINNTDFVVN